MSCDLCLSPAPSLGLDLDLLSQECGNATENVSASCSDQILHLHCCCGDRWAWSRCCCGDWSWTWGGVRGERADVVVVIGCDCVSENVSVNCRSLSDCVCCCNWGSRTRQIKHMESTLKGYMLRLETDFKRSYCLRGERDLDRERVLEWDRLPLLLFLPIFTSFLNLEENKSYNYKTILLKYLNIHQL